MNQELEALFDLRGQVAMVTGGARHLGYDAACILAAAGANLVITSRTTDAAQTSAEKLRATYGIDALALQLDQTAFANVESVITKATSWKGKVDILVNNAGGGSGKSPSRLFERAPEDIDALLQTNLNGLIYCCRQVGKVMSEQQSGKIINIASIAGFVGRDRKMYDRSDMLGQPVEYAAAKAGVIGLTKDLAAYLAPMGIHVNAISPGGFDRDLPDSFVRDYSERTAMNRMGRDGTDLKGAVLFLATSASDYVTGHNLVVDGGFSIWH